MFKYVVVILSLFFLLPSNGHASVIDLKGVKAAIIRDGNLWTIINGKEKQITNSGNVYQPEWSHDGKQLLFLKKKNASFTGNGGAEIWSYHIGTNEKQKVYHSGYHPQWSPNQNTIAFQDKGVLNISNLNRFFNVSLGVYNYTWLPDGTGFLLSSRGELKPNGWTNAIIYIKKIVQPFSEIRINENIEHFFTIPKQVGINSNSVLAIHPGSFSFSPSTRWISFIVSPTASWSMDSNMLCVISSNSKKFEVLGEVIHGVGEPKWAPTKDILAFIAGGGRIVFGFKNKKLKFKELPAGSVTPDNYAELDFTWVDDRTIISSRVKETEWSNDFAKHPSPSLFKIDLHMNKQVQITDPPNGKGDYHPQYSKALGKLIWFRANSLTDNEKDLWISNIDGTDTRVWMDDIDSIVFYE